MRRGDIWLCNLGVMQGSEQAGTRPVIIVSHDGINEHAPIAIVVPLTSQVGKRALPTHVEISKNISGLQKDSLALAEQVRVVSKARLIRRLGSLPPGAMRDVATALKKAQDLD